MLANWISFIRFLLSVALVGVLAAFNTSTTDKDAVYTGCLVLTLVVIWMDGLDGYVARKFNQASKAGAVIDILFDRAVEYAYWIGFLALGWVPLWMVLTVTLRGVLVDGLRSLALEQGYTAFGSITMMQHPISILLVSSRFSRWTYAVCKALVFMAVIALHTPFMASTYARWLDPLTQALLWITVIFCVIRGLPVLIEAQRFLFDTPSK